MLVAVLGDEKDPCEKIDPLDVVVAGLKTELLVVVATACPKIDGWLDCVCPKMPVDGCDPKTLEAGDAA